MKKFFRYGLTAIVLAFVLSTLAASETNAQVVNEILKRMDKYYRSLTSLRTNITSVKYDPALKETETIEGRAIFSKKRKTPYFRIDWTSPLESLSVIDKKYMIYRPNLKQAIVGTTEKGKDNSAADATGLPAFLNMSKAQFKANYSIRYIGEEKVNGTTATWHLELMPKTAQKNYKAVDIWVDGDGMLIQMRTTECNDYTTTVLLTKLEPNVKLNGSDFAIKLPKDVRPVIVPSTADAPTDWIVKLIDTNYKNLTSLRAEIVREDYESGLKDSSTRKGMMIFLPARAWKSSLRIDWTKPDESLSVIDKQYLLYQPKLKTAYIGSTDKAQKQSNVSGSLGFLNMSKTEIKANYTMKYLGEDKIDNCRNAWHLELTPKKRRGYYKTTDIWIDRTGMPVKFRLTQWNNDTVTVRLNKIKRNVKLQAADFKIVTAKDTKIIKD